MEDQVAAAAPATAVAGDEAPQPAVDVSGVTEEDKAKYGFERAEMGKEALAGTVGGFDRHLFLCYKSPDVWPSHLESAESDRLPRHLAAALKARKDDIKKRTRLTICGGEDGTESSNGDVLIFPDMIRYRGLTHFDVDNFVEEVLVKDSEWLPGAAEKLTGSYVFVCAHGSRDKRCGVCGPALIEKFTEEIASSGLQGQVSVSPCSHVGGHKYAGNVIIFSPNADGAVSGHWYGYVTPDDVPVLLEEHISKGKIVDHLWRGQMGLSEEEQKSAQSLRQQMSSGLGEKGAEEGFQPTGNNIENGTLNGAVGCCQGTRNASCCQVESREAKPENNHTSEQAKKVPQDKNNKGSSSRKICSVSTWFENWEREDTYATLAVVAAVASIAVAYTCFKQMR
ncbi:Thioredoxin-like ferredoxin protein [Dioscorea alata]|uniref:Thioredoxin-like ferredoxin protein n=1 Tax=Dioscorea alata TaxID=55571 RepID=A0ACB7UIZ9_DIOAL|nr:Thioredoxin-like ferredoxin protein [Dioscorea alata]